jgi:putative Ca2+/H+ antiporter (TMEM165/GDT1 family)
MHTETLFILFYEEDYPMRKINGETVTGIALIFLAILFIMAGMVNPVWALLFWADVLILVIGVAFMILGMWTLKKDLQRTRHKA